MIDVIDCGGRYGPHRCWDHFGLPMNYFGVEPDSDEVSNLLSNQPELGPQGGSYNIIPRALSDRTGDEALYLYSLRDASSLFELNTQATYRYGHVTLDKAVQVPTTTLDAAAAEFGITPRFLSIDAQGATLKILQGAPESMGSLLGLRCEVEYFPLYKNAPLAEDVFGFLRGRGYRMLRMEMCGPGLYGISTEMNRFSVSPWDAKPSSCDMIYANEPQIERLCAAPVAGDNALAIAYFVVFCLHNGAGYYGLETLERAHGGDGGTFLGALSANVRRELEAQVAAYLSIPRHFINKTFNGDEVHHAFFGYGLANAPVPGDRETRRKIEAIYSQPYTPTEIGPT